MAERDLRPFIIYQYLHYILGTFQFCAIITGGNIRASAAESPLISTFTPVPAGTQPSPKARSRATLQSNPEQCIGSTYVGAGRNLFARKSTVGAIRSNKSGVQRCKPPIIYRAASVTCIDEH